MNGGDHDIVARAPLRHETPIHSLCVVRTGPAMKVSVILTVLNEGAGLVDLLDALLAQSRPADEFVIVDGGSCDDTIEILQRYAIADVRFNIHREPGVNIARGRNIAIERASGEVMAVTDGGCRPERDWLAELLAPMEADPSVGAVGGRFVPASHSRFEYYCGKMSVPDLGGESQRGMFYGRSSAFCRALWLDIGGYPEWLYTGEDTLFALSAGRLSKYKIVYAPASILHWRPRQSLSKMIKMFYLYGRGNGRIQHGNVAGALYWLKYHVTLLVSLVAGGVFPLAWLVTLMVTWHLYQSIVKPNLSLVQSAGLEPADRLFYVPLIALMRNIATNCGYLRGWLEHRAGGDFKQQLDRYLRRP